MTGRSQIYNIEGYIELVSALLDVGYSICPLSELESGKARLFLRHDVDMCLERAAAMAEAENAAGFRSTYYVLVRTEMYNISSRTGRDAVKRIRSLGHEVGLHFDSAGLADNLKCWDAEAADDCTVLEAALAGPVSSISFHRPSQQMQGLQASIAGRPHVYQSRYFREVGYCSDSAGGFRFHHPLDHPAVIAKRALQLLTHPIWWMGRLGSPRDKLDRFVDDRLAVLKDELAMNCKVYQR
jgi:hypothetical protein